MTIDELIEQLVKFDQNLTTTIKYNHEYAEFGDLDSYRGYYQELAVDRGRSDKTVGQVIEQLKEACGKTFIGYKGGEFTMHGGTDVYFAEYGNTGPIVDHVYEKDGAVYLFCVEDF